MTTSLAMPDVVVEIAFDSGYSTPSGSRTWTDVSAYVELKDLIKITRGRQDEKATTEPSKVEIRLDNSDGRFTALRPASPYFPNVKIGRPIRVTVTPVGGAPSVRFLGYVDEWPLEWDDTDAYAYARITARSRSARLGFDMELRSTVYEYYEPFALAHWWPLYEDSQATSAADLGVNPTTLNTVNSSTGDATPFEFQGLPGPQGDPTQSTRFKGGQSLRGILSPLNAAVAPIVLETFYYVPTSESDEVLRFTDASGFNDSLAMSVFATGMVNVDLTGPTGLRASVTSDAGAVRAGVGAHLATVLSLTGGTAALQLYVNGALVDSVSSPGYDGPGVFRTLHVGAGGLGPTLNFGLAHVALSDNVAGIALRSAAINGFDGESAGDRIVRLAALAGVPVGEVAYDSDTVPIAPVDTSGRTAIDAMRVIEQTEGGVLFDSRDNKLTVHSRVRRYNSNSAMTFDLRQQEIETGISPKLDRSSLVNDVTGTARDGSTWRAVNQASVDDYGVARDTVEVAADPLTAEAAAWWQVNTYGEPQARIPSLGVEMLPLSGSRQADLLDLDVSSRITLDNLPAQAASTLLSFFVEGYTETIGRESYSFDFNVSPTTGFDVWTCEDGTFGALDEYPIAY